ncbi:hypothetical protein P2318_07890 [Myxococcaceae bacterium GXIMD 01537]
MRLPLSALTRPVDFTPEDQEYLSRDPPESPLDPESCERLVLIPHSLVETLETPAVWGPFPEEWETAETYLPRVAETWGVRQGVVDLIVALGGQFIARESFDTHDATWRYVVWIDQLVRGYGDLDLLGFLLVSPARSDMERHFDRAPVAARRLVRQFPSKCLSSREGQALNAALAAAKADGFAKLQAHLRGAEAERYASFLTVNPEEEVLDLFLSNEAGGAYHASDYYEERGARVRVDGPPILGVTRKAWRMVGAFVLIVVGFFVFSGVVGVLLNGLLKLLRLLMR